MFNTIMDILNGAISAFSEDVLILIAVGAIVLCLIIGLLFSLLSPVRREKINYKKYNKLIKKRGLKTSEDFDSLNVLIIKKITTATFSWKQCYPQDACTLVRNTPPVAPPAGRVRRTVTLLIICAAAAYLFLALDSIVIPAMMLIIVFIFEALFAWGDVCAHRRLTREQNEFQIKVTKALIELYCVTICGCCRGKQTKGLSGEKKEEEPAIQKSAPEPAKEEEEKKTVTELKESSEPEILEPKPEPKPIIESKPEPVYSQPKPKRVRTERKAETKPTQVKEEAVAPNFRTSARPKAEAKPKPATKPITRAVSAPAFKPENTVVEEEPKRVVKPEPRIERNPEPRLASKPEPAPKPEYRPVPKFETAPKPPRPTPRPEPVYREKPAPKPEYRPAPKPETAPKPTPKPTPRPEPVYKEKPAPKTVTVAREEKKPVEDKMAALSARLGTLRQTITETTVEQTVEKQVSESVTVRTGGEITSSSERSSYTLAANQSAQIAIDGKVVEQSGYAAAINRDREVENDKVLKDTVTVISASSDFPLRIKEPVSAPKISAPKSTSAGLYSAPRPTPKKPSPPSKVARYDEGEVKNALSGLMFAMNKQQSQHETIDEH